MDGRKPYAKKWEENPQEDHTYKLTREELVQYKSNWGIALGTSGSNAPIGDFKFEEFMSAQHWGEFKNYALMNFSKRKLIEDQNSIEHLTWKCRNYKMKTIVWMTQGASRMLNQYAVDHYHTLPVNWPCFLFLLTQEDCWAALKIRSMIFGIRTVYRETFLRIRMLNSSAPCSKTLNIWHDPAAERIPAQESTVTPLAGVSDRARNTNPTPEILKKFVCRKFFLPYGG